MGPKSNNSTVGTVIIIIIDIDINPDIPNVLVEGNQDGWNISLTSLAFFLFPMLVYTRVVTDLSVIGVALSANSLISASLSQPDYLLWF